MMRAHIAAVLAVPMLLAPTLADADDYIPPVIAGQTYTQHLITAAKARHPEIAAIEVEGRREGDHSTVVFGSTRSAARVLSAVAHPAPDHGAGWTTGKRAYVVREPFKSNSGHVIGTTMITFRPGVEPSRMNRIADEVANGMARATLSAKNAVDPWPYSRAFGPNTYAQTLTERTVARHPDLLVMMIHATPPGGKTNVIIGSNIGRFGKAADEDDLRVIDKGETNLEVGGDKDRFETELPLNDAHGARIGALGLVFHYREGADKEAIHAHGLSIRDEIARQIPNSAALFRRRP